MGGAIFTKVTDFPQILKLFIWEEKFEMNMQNRSYWSIMNIYIMTAFSRMSLDKQRITSNTLRSNFVFVEEKHYSHLNKYEYVIILTFDSKSWYLVQIARGSTMEKANVLRPILTYNIDSSKAQCSLEPRA